jgi:LPS-assembly lipoprotein
MTQPGNRLSLAGLALACLALTACGFQLRGATAVPDALNPLYVACEGNTPPALCEQIRGLLSLNEVVLTEEPTPQSYILQVNEFNRTQRATAITASASAAEYDLRLQSTISLFAPGEVPLMADAAITANEVYRFDETNILAERREREELTQQLYQRLAQQIIYRLTPFSAQRIEALRADYQSQQESDADVEVPAN